MGTFGDGTPNFHSYSAAIWFESVHAGLEVLCHVITIWFITMIGVGTQVQRFDSNTNL